MAVRRQLRELFQDPQPLGTIVVERPSSPTAAVPIPQSQSPPLLPPPPPPSPPLLPPQPASPPPSPPLSPPPSSSLPPAADPASPPRPRRVLPELCAVFHCRDCWTVLGDSLHLCSPGTPRHGFLVCCKVTSDVVWEDSLLVGLEAPLLGCAYNALSCRSCGLAVGFILYSSPSDLASIRGLFSFFKDRLLCYVLEKQTVIEASEIDFPAVALKKQLKEMKDRVMELDCHIALLTKKLEELEKIKCVTEQESSASETDGLPSECATARNN